MNARVRMEESWRQLLCDEFDLPYMVALREFLLEEKRRGKRIYPPGEEMFAALNNTPVERVKVVIIGQDPYHGAGQAHGLCFSVQAGVALPPSLINVFREVGDDIGGSPENFRSGCLTGWARQGVLLLNSVLTVEHGRAGSHQGRGWERFTDAVVAGLVAQRSGLVFMLWGGYAQKKGAMVDRTRHCVLTAPHPSPLSAHRGFIGCRHFSAANEYLVKSGVDAIDWLDID